jgi:hypothetical protein
VIPRPVPPSASSSWCASGREGPSSASRTWTASWRRTCSRLDDWYELVCQANEPSVLAENAPAQLEAIHAFTFLDHGGRTRPAAGFRGAADPQDPPGHPDGRGPQGHRKPRAAHLGVPAPHPLDQRAVPGARDRRRPPRVSQRQGLPPWACPPEDPRGQPDDDRADIYDALTANDRPYKRAVPHQKALDILGFEVKDGKVDPALLDIFISRQVWKVLEPANA